MSSLHYKQELPLTARSQRGSDTVPVADMLTTREGLQAVRTNHQTEDAVSQIRELFAWEFFGIDFGSKFLGWL